MPTGLARVYPSGRGRSVESAPALRRKRVTFTLLFGTQNTASQRGASMSLACESKLTLHYIAHPASAHVSKSKIRRHLKSEVRTVPDYTVEPLCLPNPSSSLTNDPGWCSSLLLGAPVRSRRNST